MVEKQMVKEAKMRCVECKEGQYVIDRILELHRENVYVLKCTACGHIRRERKVKKIPLGE
jgi:uncharacterized Zn finger protein